MADAWTFVELGCRLIMEGMEESSSDLQNPGLGSRCTDGEH